MRPDGAWWRIPGLLDRRRPAQPRAAPNPTPTTRRRLYGYLAAAVLPLYVLHQPIVVAVAYFVVGWSAPILVEYVVLVVISLILTLTAYELLVRRTRRPASCSGCALGAPRSVSKVLVTATRTNKATCCVSRVGEWRSGPSCERCADGS